MLLCLRGTRLALLPFWFESSLAEVGAVKALLRSVPAQRVFLDVFGLLSAALDRAVGGGFREVLMKVRRERAEASGVIDG